MPQQIHTGERHDVTFDKPCAACGEPLTVAQPADGWERERDADPGQFSICLSCAERLICRAIIATQGEHIEASNAAPGHERRMDAHARRIGQDLARLSERHKGEPLAAGVVAG